MLNFDLLMTISNSIYPQPEKRGSRVKCPALNKWITDRDCELRRNAPYCISCNPCPLKAAGCNSCGKPFVSRSTFQLYCNIRCKRDATNRRRLQMRRKWKASGLCIYCGKHKVQEGRSHLGCQACLDMHSQARKLRSA